MTKIAIYGRPTSDNVTTHVQVLFDELTKGGAQLIVHQEFGKFISNNFKNSHPFKTFDSHEQLIKSEAQCLLSLGGDGTFLETISLIKNSGIPVLGINTGRLGFLANVSKENIKSCIALLLNEKFTLDKRILLKVEGEKSLISGDNFVLNEVTVHKKDTSSMITINAWVNNDFVNSYWADGLIIATPTGSTAYSLSCGGPIVVPDSANIIITPIAPHNLNVRPLVIADSSIIKLKIEGRGENNLLTLDSRSYTIKTGIEIVIKKEDFCINLIKLEGQDFLNTMRNKLLWGLDKRN